MFLKFNNLFQMIFSMALFLSYAFLEIKVDKFARLFRTESDDITDPDAREIPKKVYKSL